MPPKQKRTPLQKRIRRLEVRLQRSRLVQGALRGLIRGYVRLIHRSSRWQTLDLDRYGPGGDQSAAVLCVWHETLPGTTHALGLLERDTKAIASDHADGLIVVDVLADLGFESLLVPTSGDKTGAMRVALRHLRRGGSVCITPDGPMGPAREAKPGAVTLAALAGVPLVPFAYATRPALRLPTWDKMLLPLPFSRAALSAGEPITVPRRLSPEEEARIGAELGAAIDAQMARCEAALQARR